MSAVRRGTEAERRVVHHLRNQGWLVASRRHIGGAGDLLALKPGQRGRLVEVKSTKTPFAHFTRLDRDSMLAIAERYDLDPLLAWSPSPSKFAWLAEGDWP